jgi:hypothetical protein
MGETFANFMQGNPTPTPESIGLITGTTGLALLATETQAEAQSVIGASSNASGSNAFINGGMAIDQVNRGAAQTITAGAALAYTVDQWYAYAVGGNVTGQRIQGATAGRFRYQLTGAASVTAIGFGQRIEQLNCVDLAGTTATLSVDLANSLLTSITWTAYYANTADTFGTLALPTRVQFATGTFTVSSTVARYSAQISIPIEAVTGIEIVFSVGAQTSGTWTIGDAQLEKGIIATPFITRARGDIGLELVYCQRYREVLTSITEPTWNDGTGSAIFSSVVLGTNNWAQWVFKATKRAAPTVALAPGNIWAATPASISPQIDNVILKANTLFYNIGPGGKPGLIATSYL